MTKPSLWSSRMKREEFLPIHSGSPRRNLVGSGVMVFAALGQIVGLMRYVRRLPGDVIGIGLYFTTAAFFVFMAALLFRKWRRLRGDSD